MKIGITNLKGGVGKTTLSINLSVCFAHMGYKVCIVDTDANKNSVQWNEARDEGLPEVMVVEVTEPKNLSKTVQMLNNQYDIIIMDGTPHMGEMNTRVMMTSDLLIIPIRPGPNDFRAMSDFMDRINQVKEVKGELAAYFLINEYDERKTAHKTVKGALQENFELPILETLIKSRTVYGEATLMGNGVFEHDDDKAKVEIASLTKELLELAEKHSQAQ